MDFARKGESPPRSDALGERDRNFDSTTTCHFALRGFRVVQQNEFLSRKFPSIPISEYRNNPKRRDIIP